MSSETRSTPRAGDVLDGRFRLVQRLGHGGFGDVWRAEELLPDGAPFRDVALKLLHTGGADALDWAEEAKLLASFRHPSLVTIYAAGILAAAPPRRFVAMELLEGRNLAELLRARGRVAWRRVLAWAASAAAALDLIHAAGVVHLDLKPANLFLCEGGALKVLDFGIARRAGVGSVLARRGDRLPAAVSVREAEAATGLLIADHAASHGAEAFAATRPVDGAEATLVDPRSPRASGSSPRVVIGTPGYMAPEILELAEPTAAADAYALAVCVVQLVSGHLPLAAPDEPTTWDDPTAVSAWLDAIRSATLRGALRPLDAASMGLPRGLAALLLRLLAVDPAARAVTPGKLGALFEEVWERPHGVPDPPYFGLSAYPPEGEGLLFGRDDDVARLGRELSIEPAILLQGPAGAGKSSLAAAGLVPYLARVGADGKDDWIAVPVTDGSTPDAALAAALGRVSPELSDASVDDLAAWCDRSPVGLVLLLDPVDALASGPSRARLAALCEALGAGVVRPGLRLLGALREEAAAGFLDDPVGRSLRAALRFVGPPATAAVKDIVAAPAHFAGVPVYGADRLAADVQRELRAGGVRLPHVALALADLWPHLKARAPDAVDRWMHQGGVRGAVVRHAERALAALPDGERDAALALLLRLSSTDGRPVRWDRAELCAAAPEHGERLLGRLAREHLVHVGRDVVEIGHEVLITGWPTLASARLAQMDRLAFLERVREARVAWERAENHRDLLLRGALLDEVHAHAEWVDAGLTPADRAYVAQSQRRERLRRVARWATVVLVVLLAVGGAWGQQMLDEARDAEARARAAQAEQAQLAELSARARRTDDPYHRVAFAATAMERGSLDGMLPLEISAAAGNLARASFLTLDHMTSPIFPWDDRYLLALAPGGALAVFDFRPPEPDVIEDVDLDVDPEQAEAVHFRMPVLRRLRPHAAEVVERVPFAFDTAFATRAADGEVKVFRLREAGTPILAATAPLRCAGSVVIAAAAPVLACGVEGGIARWDMRRGAEVATTPFFGNVADVSADGEHVAAVADRQVLLWSPAAGRELRHEAPRPVAAVRFGPRDPVVAIADAAEDGAELSVVSLAPADPRRPVIHAAPLDDLVPEQVRWDEGGLDVAVCGRAAGRWVYLRRGGRAKDDPRPRGEPCAPPRPRGQPEPIRSAEDYAELAEREVGAHSLAGGFRLRKRRFLSRDLVVFDGGHAAPPPTPDGRSAPVPPAAARLLRFEGRDDLGGEERRDERDSLAAVEIDDAVVMVQVRSQIRFYARADGVHLGTRSGTFVRRCADGRWLSWAAAGGSYTLFDAWSNARIADVPREPGIVLGADARCTNLYTQRLDGELLAIPIEGGALPRHLGRADGYAYLTRPSPARGPVGSGLLLAFGSGAIARLDDLGQALQIIAYASPRATALGDGPHPGEVAFADATGVIVAHPSGPPIWLCDPAAGAEWEDLSVGPDGGSMLLASDKHLSVVDVSRRELLGSIPLEGRGRLSRWDDEGSAVAWSFTRAGPVELAVVPRGVSLARAVSDAVSNLAVEKARVVIRR